MRILLTNDDGLNAPGMRALQRAVRDLGEVWTVAPHQQRSACSQSIKLREPLRVWQHGPREFSADATPADCVYLGLHELVKGPVDLVISGINKGGNLGPDVLYSGTVAGATEAVLLGVEGLACSLVCDLPGRAPPLQWESAEVWLRRVLERWDQLRPEPGSLLNLNVPDLPLEAIQGVRATRLGRRDYPPSVKRVGGGEQHTDYVCRSEHVAFLGAEDSDTQAVARGEVSLTPLSVDRCRLQGLPALERGLQSLG